MTESATQMSLGGTGLYHSATLVPPSSQAASASSTSQQAPPQLVTATRLEISQGSGVTPSIMKSAVKSSSASPLPTPPVGSLPSPGMTGTGTGAGLGSPGGGTVTGGTGGSSDSSNTAAYELAFHFDSEYIAALRRNYAALSRICTEQAEAAENLKLQLDEARAMLHQVDLREERMQQLEDQLEAANQRVKRGESEISKLEAQLESQAQRIRSLQSQLASSTRSSSDAAAKLATAQSQIEWQASELKSLQRMLADRSQDKVIETLQGEVSQLRARIQELEKTLAEERSANELREKELLRAKNIEHRYMIDKRTLTDDLERLTQRNKTLQQTIDRLNSEIQRANDQIEAKNLDIQLLRRDLAKAHEDKAKTVKAALLEASLRLEQATGNVAATQSSVLTGKTESGSDTMATPSEELVRLRGEYTVLREQFESLWEEKTQADEQLRILTETSSKVQQDVDAALKREMLHKEISSQLSSQVVELTKQVSELMSQRDGFLARVAESHSLVEQTVSELRQAHAAQDALLERNNELQKQLDELKQKLDSERSALHAERAAQASVSESGQELSNELTTLRNQLRDFKANTSTIENENTFLRTRAESLARELEELKKEARVNAAYEEMKRKTMEEAIRAQCQEEVRTTFKQSIIDEVRRDLLKELEPALRQKLRDELETEVRGQVASHLQNLESKASALTAEVLKLKHENAQLHAVIDAAGLVPD